MRATLLIIGAIAATIAGRHHEPVAGLAMLVQALTWAAMLGAFGLLGHSLRRRRTAGRLV